MRTPIRARIRERRRITLAGYPADTEKTGARATSGRAPRDPRPGDSDHGDQFVNTHEITGAGGEQRKVVRARDGRDLKIGDAPARLTADPGHRCADPTVGPSSRGIEWQGVEFMLGTLQHIHAGGALASGHDVVTDHEVHAGTQLGQGHGTGRSGVAASAEDAAKSARLTNRRRRGNGTS